MRKGLIHEILADAAWKCPDVEVISGSYRSTYEKEWQRVYHLAHGMRRIGIQKGTVVGILDVNSYRFFELQFALSMLGAINHPLNFRLPKADLLYTVQHAGDEYIFAWEGFAQVAHTMQTSVRQVIWMREDRSLAIAPEHGELTFEQLIAIGRDAAQQEPIEFGIDVEDDDIFSIFYTTGTTGRPKGMRYRHRDMLHASLQIAHHLAIHDTGAKIVSGDTMMPLIPFFHIHGWGASFFIPYLGAKLVLPERADAKEQLAIIAHEHVTWSNMVPTQLHMLLHEWEQQTGCKEHLPLRVLTGGSPLSTGLTQRLHEAGITFSLIYGGSDQLGTSISAIVDAKRLTDQERRTILATRTLPLPMVIVDVRHEEGGSVPRDGVTIGEVWVKSPWLPDGYFCDPDRSRATYSDGWFRSGDLAVWHEDSSLYVLDRQKDAVKSGGEWIATSVIESLLSECDGVIDVAVIAWPDERWGERPIAVIEMSKRANAICSEEFLWEHLRQAVQDGRLATFWIPDRIVFMDRLPMTSAGKIHKAALRETLQIRTE
ncbi:AMP-binding protein [Sulfoacidibacillus ferrooxidans]|uniref:Long-chain-fatty-acid--CoA ligase n=1 Tax=Sulfoacidibacillus ferrooxidans TaxID=2005001 RepID=A0A9X1V7H3_9BACL|nr:AMP-binding protein [Sulfoacidibacillus ferrooxidans]MCI0182419.1 Long-chain-fatty-acid--CoA ligase [Sulfoacidibacillus ferrooxidans]